MNYSFDTIKKRRTIFLLIFFTSIFPFIPFAILNVRAWFPSPPSIFISLVLPIFSSVLITLILIKNKKKLFWSKLNLSIDKRYSSININEQQHSFSDLEYFDCVRGSSFTTGIERFVLFLKFKGEKKVMIMPCKSSKDVETYDNFINEFSRISKIKNLQPKVLKHKVNPLLVAFTLIPIVIFTITFIINGQRVAIQQLPFFLTPSVLFFSVIGVSHFIKKSGHILK